VLNNQWQGYPDDAQGETGTASKISVHSSPAKF
jgi:hypothetical protein